MLQVVIVCMYFWYFFCNKRGKILTFDGKTSVRNKNTYKICKLRSAKFFGNLQHFAPCAQTFQFYQF